MVRKFPKSQWQLRLLDPFVSHPYSGHADALLAVKFYLLTETLLPINTC